MNAISATFPLVKRSAPLWLLVLVTFSGTLAMHMFVPALTVAGHDLNVDAATIRMTISVYIFGLAVGQLVYGPLSDVFGRRPTLDCRSVDVQVVPRDTAMSSCVFDDAAYDAPAATCAVALSTMPGMLLIASFSPDTST